MKKGTLISAPKAVLISFYIELQASNNCRLISINIRTIYNYWKLAPSLELYTT